MNTDDANEEPSTYERIVLRRHAVHDRNRKGGVSVPGSRSEPHLPHVGSGGGIGRSRVGGTTDAASSAVESSNDDDGSVCGGLEGVVRWHVWNPDNSWTVAAISSRPDPTSISIYSLSAQDDESGTATIIRWKKLHRLNGHHHRPITHFDWSNTNTNSNTNNNTNNITDNVTDKNDSPLSNDNNNNPLATDGRIVSCGEDCRAFVWSYDPSLNEWTAGRQVVLQQQTICLTPLCCRWDTTGERFAIGMGGDRSTASLEICSRKEETEDDNGDEDGEEEEWTAYRVGRKEIGSSLLCLDWHPCRREETQIVACGGCDGFCRVFSVSSGESKSDGDDRGANDRPILFDEVLGFGKQYAEYTTENQSWIVAVAWSPSGNTLAYCSHDTTVGIVTFSHDRTDDPPPPILIRSEGRLPTCDMIFCNEDRLVTCGHDGRLVSVSRAATETEGGTEDGDGGGRGTWNVDTEGELGVRNGRGGETEDSTGGGAVRCVRRCPSTLRFGTVDDDDDGGVTVPSVWASGSGDDGSFCFFELKRDHVE